MTNANSGTRVAPYLKRNCNIIMKDGTVKFNDRELGWNLEKCEIETCFEDTGRYDLFTKEKGWERIYPNDVKEIVEVED